MKFIKNLLHRYSRYMTYLGRARARKVLLKRSDRLLEDAGFSPQLLESGVKAWPWHAPAVALAPLKFEHFGNVPTRLDIQPYSDNEPNDPCISRSLNSKAVIVGRDGIDNDSERKVA